MNNIFLSTLLSLIVFSSSGFANTELNERAKAISDSVVTLNDLPELKPDIAQIQAGKLVSQLVSFYHYRRNFKFDDAFSEKAFDTFIKQLDPARIYLTSKDLNDFQVYRSKFDDIIYDGDLEPAFIMFKRFRQRWVERYQHSLKLLETEFDFTLDENFIFDREDAAWSKDINEHNEMWRKKIKNDVLSFILAKKSDKEAAELLQKRYKAALRRISQTESIDVFRYFMDSVTQTIEPHTNYFSPRTAKNFNIDMALSLEGIGAVLQTEDVYTKVVRLVTGGPADRTDNLAKDDIIVAVGQGDKPMEDVIGWRLDDVVDLIRGKSGTKVKLEVLPAGAGPDAESKLVHIVREKIKLEDQEAKSSVIEVENNGETLHFGVITLPKFYIDFEALYRGEKDYKSTTRDVRSLIESLKKQDVDGLIMDLRNNGGGSLMEATSLTGLFIDSGPVVQERDYKNRIKIHEDLEAGTSFDGPLMVLVNRFSASASEIFAGAIQDYGRGLIVGDTTYGKGTIQQVRNLDQWKRSKTGKSLGQLKFTSARFYRVSGDSTQIRGVVPDVALPASVSESDYGEVLLEHALPWDNIKSVKHKKYPNIVHSTTIDKLRSLNESRISKDPAFNLLKNEFEELSKLRERTQISLNKEVRLKEREVNRKKDLARINARRQIQGLEKLTDIDSIANEDPANSEQPEIEPFDPRLKEAGRILTDYIQIGINHKKIASTLPKAS